MAEETGREAGSRTIKKQRNQVVTMVPLFRLRSIMTLTAGTILGAALGIGYWMVSPSLTGSLSAVGPSDIASVVGPPHEGPYESRVNIQLVNPGSSYVYLRDLQQRGEYYAAKAKSIPFLEYLEQKLSEEAPEYSRVVSRLDQMLTVKYVWNSQVPAIEMKVIGLSDKEALFLASFVPEVFRSYLVTEEKEMRLRKYENALRMVESARKELLQAEKELSGLVLEAAVNDVGNDPTYLSLNAIVEALDAQLRRYTDRLAILVAEGDTSDGYNLTLNAVERTSQALGEAKRHLSGLKAQLASEQLLKNFDYQNAQAKVSNLKRQLANLTENMNQSLDRNKGETEATDYLAIASPSRPFPVLPDRVKMRNALMTGVMFGAVGAWALLNFRWITKVLLSQATAKDEGRDEG